MPETDTAPVVGLNEDGRRRVRHVAAMIVVMGLAIVLPAGRLDFRNGWVYLGLYVGAVLVGGSWLVRHHPEVVNERGRKDETTKRFDRVLAPFMLVAGLAQYVVAGLDARFGWTDVPRALEILGGIGFVASMAGVFWAMANNPFLATTVRIRADGSHRVASTGPYRVVRHPMYAANVWFFWVTGLLLDSWWTLLCSVIGAALFVVRTALEDRALCDGLDGYREYAGRVRYRLVPGVW